MTELTIHEEFEFIQGNLEKIVSLLIEGSPHCIAEASFLVGCLHTRCNLNANRFDYYDKVNADGI